MNQSLNIIIPAAGFGYRHGYNVPKSLVQVGENKLIDIQISLLKKHFPNARITYIVGFQRSKLADYRKDVRLIINRRFEETGVAYSIGLAVQRQLRKSPCLIIYGDLVFNEDLILMIKSQMLSRKSFVLTDDQEVKKTDIGVNIYQDKVVSFSYQPLFKWNQIAYLSREDAKNFAKLALQKKNVRCYGHEILNLMLAEGCELRFTKRRSNDILVEIDSSRDIARAKVLLNREVV